MIVHVVSFKLADAAADLDRAVELLESLPPKIPEIRRFEVGRDVVQGERSYDLVLVSEFDSLADLKTYQDHPDHLEVGAFLKQASTHVVAVDYERQD